MKPKKQQQNRLYKYLSFAERSRQVQIRKAMAIELVELLRCV